MITKTNGEPCINIVVSKKADSDAVRVAQRVKALLAEYNKELPQGVRSQVIKDYSVYVNSSVNYTVVGNVDLSASFAYVLQGNVSSNSYRAENRLSWPFNSTMWSDEFLQGIGVIAEKMTKLIRSGANDYSFYTHLRGVDDGKNFTMDVGEAYAVYVNVSSNYTIS